MLMKLRDKNNFEISTLKGNSRTMGNKRRETSNFPEVNLTLNRVFVFTNQLGGLNKLIKSTFGSR